MHVRAVRDQPVAAGAVADDAAVQLLVEAHALDGEQIFTRSLDQVPFGVEEGQEAEIVSGLCGGHEDHLLPGHDVPGCRVNGGGQGSVVA